MLFTPNDDKPVPFDYILDSFPLTGFISVGLLVLLLIYGIARLIQIFWNSLIADLFKTRDIDFQEAMAISLIFSLFTI